MPVHKIDVRVSMPLSTDGTAHLITPHPLVISGVPRKGPTPGPCEHERAGVVTVCVGLPQFDLTGTFRYVDTAHQPGDISRALEVGGDAEHLELVTVIGATHEDPCRNCGAASQYVRAWIAHQFQGAPAPDNSIVTSSGCSAFGLVDGGTTGPGAAAPFIPAT